VNRGGRAARSGGRGERRSGRARRGAIIGVAGQAGSGKSTVARLLARGGARVIELDRIGHECLRRPGVKRALARAFGEGIFDGRGRVKRSSLAGLAFASPAACRRLDAAVHPALVAEVRRRIRTARRERRRAVVAGTLLFELGLDRDVDGVVYVDAPFAMRARRLRASRGWSEAELRRRDRCQSLSAGLKRRRSDIVIVNKGSLSLLRERVGQIREEM